MKFTSRHYSVLLLVGSLVTLTCLGFAIVFSQLLVEPRIDASSQESFERSFARVEHSLKPHDLKALAVEDLKFDDLVMAAVFYDIDFEAAAVGTSVLEAVGFSTIRERYFYARAKKSLNGLTAREIIALGKSRMPAYKARLAELDRKKEEAEKNESVFSKAFKAGWKAGSK